MKVIAVVFLVLILGCSGSNEKFVKSKPNVVIILLDDMGFSDISAYGSEIKTPNIDALAESGLKFSQFYNNGRCCPTRATLLTGLYPQQVGLGYMAESTSSKKPAKEKDKPTGYEKYVNTGYQGFLNEKCVTIAEVLRPMGYHTFLSGKWHLGFYDKKSRPLQRGFDRFYGFLQGTISFFHPSHKHSFGRGLTLNNKSIELDPNEEYYTTDAITDYAIKFIDEARQKDDKPFFLYLSYNAPHFPQQSKKENYEKYLDKYSKGWKHLRSQRLARMKKLGIMSADVELSAVDKGVLDWDKLTKAQQKEQAQAMAVYAGMLDSVDENIGRFITFLKKNNIYDNTVILFLSDNGASHEGGRSGRGSVEAMLNGKDHREFRVDTYSRAWANYSNTPFRYYKSYLHEGGIATPLIIQWNKGMKQDLKGSIYKKPLHIIDIMDTIIEIAGGQYPKHFKGNNIPQTEGRSFAPILAGGDVRQQPIFLEHKGAKAVRKGDWKLVYDKVEKRWELFNIVNDRTEKVDLIKKYPAKAKKLYTLWKAWAERMNVQIYHPSRYSDKEFLRSIK